MMLMVTWSEQEREPIYFTIFSPEATKLKLSSDHEREIRKNIEGISDMLFRFFYLFSQFHNLQSVQAFKLTFSEERSNRITGHNRVQHFNSQPVKVLNCIKVCTIQK